MKDDPTRFWSKVNKTDGCWLWTGARVRRPHGALSYGHTRWGGRTQPAHRVAWELTNGPVPKGLWVLHHCDNQGCVNPEHLYVGTHADNTRDAMIRRRMFSGELTWNHKLRQADLAAIQALLAAGYSTERIGSFFGVSGRTIRYIRSGEHWADVA